MTGQAVAEVLRQAEQIIGDRGWHQGGYIGDSGHVCVAGAVRIAVVGKFVPSWQLWHDEKLLDWAALDVLEEHLGTPAPTWNDEDGRTEADVRAALLAAADEADRS